MYDCNENIYHITFNYYSAIFIDVGLDIQDELGRHDVGFVENTVKTPFNAGKGCVFESLFHINRVPGCTESHNQLAYCFTVLIFIICHREFSCFYTFS